MVGLKDTLSSFVVVANKDSERERQARSIYSPTKTPGRHLERDDNKSSKNLEKQEETWSESKCGVRNLNKN